MKKKIYPMLFVAALSLSACTEVLEPNVDYGGNTFINDYSALVDAVNNLNKTLQERFDALNQLLKSNMVDIKLAIDSNTGAIKVLSEKTEQGLKDVNTSIFKGCSSKKRRRLSSSTLRSSSLAFKTAAASIRRPPWC